MARPAKRRALDDADRQSRTPTSLTRSISPPGSSRSKRARMSEPADDEETSSEPEAKIHDDDDDDDDDETSSEAEDGCAVPDSTPKLTSKQPTISKPKEQAPQKQRIFPSPFQLTKIIPTHTPNNAPYPAEYNIDTVTLSDLVGDPLISEIWEFNYLHDIDYLMSHLDPDVRHLVKVHVIHGFWKREDANRLALVEQAGRYKNVELHAAFMGEMFGTHHTKMMVLLRHDDTAEVVIHTANMIARDWRGMTQGVWRSGRLPLLMNRGQGKTGLEGGLRIGSGERFKLDFLNYLLSYEKRRPTCRGIIEELKKYDFSAVRGALVGSVPGRHSIQAHDEGETLWGWAAMKRALKDVPVRPSSPTGTGKGKGKAEVVIQISSIATLGPTDAWLRGTLFDAFSGGRVTQSTSSTGAAKKIASASKMMGLGGSQTGMSVSKPDFRIVFPTADEIRNSLDGYNSGGSIHTKISSAQQRKQLAYLKPLFYHWGNEVPSPQSSSRSDTELGVMNAGRNRAAPHIKTYIRYRNGSDSFSESGNVDIEWALLTSANLSKQAWGEAPSSTGSGEMRVASYELGVLVWPALFAEGAVMRGTFLTDTPSSLSTGEGENGNGDSEGDKAVVGLRMPYSLPLRKYGQEEIPWVATASYDEPDWRGCYWRD